MPSPFDCRPFFRLGRSARGGLLLLGLFLEAIGATAARAEGLEFVYPSSPFPWFVAEVLGVLLLVAVAILLYLLRYILGDKQIRLGADLQKSLEKSYLERQREEFKKKSEALNERIRAVRNQLSTLFTKVKNLSTTLDPEQLFQNINDMLVQEVGVSKFILFLHDREKQELYPCRWQGFPDSIKGTLIIPLHQPHFLTFAFQRRRPVYRLAATDDLETRPLIDLPPLPGTLLALPIHTQTESLGVIHLEAFQGERQEIDEADLRFLTSLGSFMGMALANANILLQTRDELTSTRQLTEQQLQEKKRLKEIFSRYTSPELVETIMKNPGSIRMGGTTKTATILFSDIAGFTRFSSRLTPEQVVHAINEYLSRMTEIVLDNNGEIDKFIGDAVMARFGVLADLPLPGLSAVRAALAMLEEVRHLQARWAQEGREGFSIRIGIATGPVLAGNIGSERRSEFTVMGTTVNLASRLEALNKELKSSLLIDEPTYEQISNEVRAVPRENVAIRGLEGTMRVYEVLGYREEAGVRGRGKIIRMKDKMAAGRSGQPPAEPLPAEPVSDATPEPVQDHRPGGGS
ncbi:MAG: Adenylate cyclase [Candidatus Ozemobacter sibiricus]|uniref:Adenylate cyclase n=1 Tax=Candidatus Ozemobacter sibiricus TaxID=2268124 RepID=A0A367ZF17_9BACT|nr:MAG: Adenylate cyclase [Candidatus Ozemobacter sibiricus]